MTVFALHTSTLQIHLLCSYAQSQSNPFLPLSPSHLFEDLWRFTKKNKPSSLSQWWGGCTEIPYQDGRWRYIGLQPQKVVRTWAVSLCPSEPPGFATKIRRDRCIFMGLLGTTPELSKCTSGVFKMDPQVSALSSSGWTF